MKSQLEVTCILIGICIGIIFSIGNSPQDFSQCLTIGNTIIDGNPDRVIQELGNNHAGQKSEKDPQSNLNVETNVEINISKNEEQKIQAKFIRPRYYSTELGIKEKLLVAVISDPESVRELGPAINQTLSPYTNKLIFFLDGTKKQMKSLNLPLVGFKSSKPSLQVLRVVSYVIENYLDKYDFFFFVTDHTYINGYHLMRLLDDTSRTIDFNPAFIEGDCPQNCLLEKGILLTRGVLSKVQGNLGWCARNFNSKSVDKSFCECVHHATNSLSPSNSQGLSQAYNKSKETSLLESYVTITQVSSPLQIYKAHRRILQGSIKNHLHQIKYIQQQIINENHLDIMWPSRSSQVYQPPTRHDVIPWETFDETSIFYQGQTEKLANLSQVFHPESSKHINPNIKDLISVIDASVKYLTVQEKAKIEYAGLQYGHKKFDPTRGMTYLLSLKFNTKKGSEKMFRRVEAFRPLTSPEIVPMPYVTETQEVVLCLYVVAEQGTDAIDFLSRLETEEKLDQISVFFLLLTDSSSVEQDPFEALKEHISRFTTKYFDNGTRAWWTTLSVSKDNLTPVALTDMAIRKLSKNTLLFVTNPKAQLDITILNKIRLNVIQGWQIYSPIPFSLFHPNFLKDITKISIARVNGWFDEFNFENVGFYVSDYITARKSIAKSYPMMTSKRQKNTKSKLWRESITKLFSMHSEVNILRAVDSSLILPYVPTSCSNSEDKELCLLKKSRSLGLRVQLVQQIITYTTNK